MSEDLTGRRLGHYKIDGVLGRGGMSVMYRATDVRLGRKVALKVMGEHITGDAEFRERFVDEARNTSAIDHPNIVPLYDFGEVDGMLYIAMRLVDGSDLAGLVADGPISPRRALDLLGQVAGALDMLHERGLVHLDLKPANVLVTSRETAGEHVYLADFGLTRRGATGHRTSSGDFLGSPTFAAPEHLRGEPVDGRTDQYALCCMVFACLTGRPPFQGSVEEVIRGHLNEDPPAATSLMSLPQGIDEVLRRGMAKRAGRRYDDCKALIAAAKDVLDESEQAPTKRTMPTVAPLASRPPGPQAPGPQAPGPQQPRPAPPPQPTGPPSGPQSAPPPWYGHPQQPPPRMPGAPPGGDPVRLRPPMPAQSASFAARKVPGEGGTAKWLLPVVIAIAAVVAVAAFLLASGSSGESGHREHAPRPSNAQLPTEVPTVER